MGDSINDGDFQGQDSTVVDPPVAPVQSEPSINPAWNPLLEQLPSSLHGMVTPHLTKWDQGVQQMVQKVHSEYEPWKPFKENNLDPNTLYQSWQAIQNLEADPQGFVQAVIQHYGLQNLLAAEQGQQPAATNEGEQDLVPFDVTQDPEFQRVTGMTEQMAQLLLAQHQQQQEAAADQQVESDLQAAKAKHGDFNEEFVLQRMYATGEDMDTAVAKYKELTNQILTQSRNPSAGAPIVMGSGGGTPSTATPVGNLSDKDRRAMIAQVLANAAANGG